MFTQEEIRRLLDIASYGTHKGQISPARTIFNAVLSASPEHSGAKLGLAHNHIAVGEFDQAETLIKSVLEKNNADMEAKCMLGLCYCLADKKDEAKPVLEEVKNSNCISKKLAEELLTNL